LIVNNQVPPGTNQPSGGRRFSPGCIIGVIAVVIILILIIITELKPSKAWNMKISIFQ